MTITDDNGNRVTIGDYVVNYFNGLDGCDPRGDGSEVMKIKDENDLNYITASGNSKNWCCQKINEEETAKFMMY
jgi:hypothetical protein